MRMIQNVIVAVIALSYLPLTVAEEPVVGFLMVDADRYYAEERDSYPYATRVLTPNGFRFGLAEWRQFFGDQANEHGTLELLRQFNVMVVDTPFDFSIMDLGPQRQRSAAAARQAWRRILTRGVASCSFCKLSVIRAIGTRTMPTSFCKAWVWKCCTRESMTNSVVSSPPSPLSFRRKVFSGPKM